MKKHIYFTIKIAILICCLLNGKALAQNTYQVKISSVRCYSNYCVWVDEAYFEKLTMKIGKVILKKDTVLCLEKNKFNILLNDQSRVIDSNDSRIDIRMKVVLYKKNKIQKIIYLENSGRYKIGNLVYEKNPQLMSFIKENYDAEFCCFCLPPCEGQDK